MRWLRAAFQVAFVLAVVLLLRHLLDNLLANVRASGLPTGFGYLDQPAGFDIRDADFRASQPVRRALIVSYQNTVRVAAVGIVLATALGIVIGVARLSSNWLVRKAAAVYVEAIRNTPVLLIIVFLYFGVMLRLPVITDAAEWLGLVVLSNRGLHLPWTRSAGPVAPFLGVVAIGLVAALLVALWRTRLADATGRPHHRWLWSALLAGVVVGGGYLALGGPVDLSLPARDGRLVEGGIRLTTTLAALLLGLVLYTASHIAEITRGSILAVPRGQDEAARAIALSRFQRLRFVILPQAFRIAVPPLASQYLNLTKNSSLAIGVGYVEITRATFTVIGNGHPAPQSVLILMSSYLVLSLLISAVANVVNRSLRLEGG